MSRQLANPPYFETLLRRLAQQDVDATAAFGRHVHWGYWPDASAADGTPEDYGAAAERLVQVLLDASGVRDGLRILDVGCGFGGTIASMNERLAECALVGVNIDARQLRRAADAVRARHGNSIRLIQADAANLPLADRQFDVVLAVECVFHFHRSSFFAEVSRLLRPGGNLTLSDFVPSDRALEYFDHFDWADDQSVRWAYGDVDLTCSIDRYRQLAAEHRLQLRRRIDVTEQTLPTYDFLYAMTTDGQDSSEAELFTRATRRLEKACRNGMISYQILRFERE